MATVQKLLTETKDLLTWTETKIKENLDNAKAIMIVMLILNVLKTAWEVVQSQLSPDIFAGYETFVMIGSAGVTAINIILNIIQMTQKYEIRVATMATSIDKFRSIEDSLERAQSDNARNSDTEYHKRMSEKLRLTKFGMTIATGDLFEKKKLLKDNVAIVIKK
jgi:hypothetical protein